MQNAADLHERFASLLEADLVVPEQFFAGLRRGPHEPERMLLIAVLEDAIHCFQKYAFATRPRYRQLFRDAYDWFMQEPPRPTDESHPWLSFEFVCAALNLDPDYLRDGLRRWLDHRMASRPLPPTKPAAARARQVPGISLSAAQAG